ncbi:MAG: sugar O-acetyltransferase [Kiritimatiellia bacterium]
MTEKEKMLAGELYDGRDPELLNRYWIARKLIQRFNGPDVIDPDARVITLRELLGQAGERCWIDAPFHCDYGDNIYIGKDVYIGYDCIFQDDNRITIGDDCLIGAGTILSTPEHPIVRAQRLLPDTTTGGTRYTTRTRPVTIGNGCWLGAGVRVLPGVTIGEGCVVGAGSVVNRDLPPNTVCAGVPCRVLRAIE